MGTLSKALIILSFGGLGLTAYAGSTMGWGISNVMSHKTMDEIKQSCPDYYTNRNGDCLRTTFRSYYLMTGLRGGGFGSGK